MINYGLHSEEGEGKGEKKHPTILKVSDELWDKIKSIFPKEKPLKTVGGRPIISYRKVIDGILYVLRTGGCQWKMLSKEYGTGSSTCHRRFQKWNSLDIFKKIWIRILKLYDNYVGINWT